MENKNVENKNVIETVVLRSYEEGVGMVTNITYTYDDKTIEEIVFSDFYVTEEVEVKLNDKTKKDDKGKAICLKSAVITAKQYKQDYLLALQKAGLLHSDTGDNVINVKWKTNQQDAKRRLLQAEIDGTGEVAQVKDAMKNPEIQALIIRLLNGETLTAEEQAKCKRK